MHRTIAIVFGLVVGVLGVAGLFVEGSRLLDLMNVDLPLDVLRLVLAAALLGAAFAMRRAVRPLLIATGVLYLGMAAIALLDPTILGMLPTGFSGFDIAFHVVTGVVALVAGLLRGRDRHAGRPAAHATGVAPER
jgi:hypothetical protein